MALIKCPECGKEISNSAKSCPHCGYPLDKEQPVKQEVVDETKQFSNEPEEIKRYRREIDICRRRRVVMVTIGSVLAGLSLVLIILLAVFYYRAVIDLAMSHYSDPETIRITNAIVWYVFGIVMASLVMTAGMVLIVVGAVTNSVKIKKRENRIRLWERTK